MSDVDVILLIIFLLAWLTGFILCAIDEWEKQKDWGKKKKENEYHS